MDMQAKYELYADLAEQWLDGLYGICDACGDGIDLRLISPNTCDRLHEKRNSYKLVSTSLEFYRGHAEYQEMRVIDLQIRAYDALRRCQRTDAHSALSHWLAHNPVPTFPTA